jgi:hypothetical protein
VELDAPDYSIVVPAYNEEILLPRTIESLPVAMPGAGLAHELAICDSRSTVTTAAAARGEVRVEALLRAVVSTALLNRVTIPAPSGTLRAEVSHSAGGIRRPVVGARRVPSRRSRGPSREEEVDS